MTDEEYEKKIESLREEYRRALGLDRQIIIRRVEALKHAKKQRDRGFRK